MPVHIVLSFCSLNLSVPKPLAFGVSVGLCPVVAQRITGIHAGRTTDDTTLSPYRAGAMSGVEGDPTATIAGSVLCTAGGQGC